MKNKNLRSFLLGFLFISTTASLDATPTTGNYAEMAMALAAVPFDMAAQTYEVKKEAKRAAAFHLTADALSIITKVLFFYNNIAAQKVTHEQGQYTEKDFVTQGAFLMHDFRKVYRHLKPFIPVSNNDEDLVDESVEKADESSPDELVVGESSKLAYAWKIFGLPSLKGLTAFALACTQEYTTRYAGERSRFVVTAAYSLVRIIEEYTLVYAHSPYKAMFALALITNAVWLAYELFRYATQPQMILHQGDCVICSEDTSLHRLHCGHSFCNECLNGVVQAQYTDRGPQFHRTPCPEPTCRQPMNRFEMQEITHNDSAKMRRFDRAAFEWLRSPTGLDQAALDALRARGGMQCPRCRAGIERNMGCNHMTCVCGNEFCWICGRNYVNRQHPAPRCNQFGGDPLPTRHTVIQ